MNGSDKQPNIARALRRSRGARAAMRSRRRRSLAIAACAFIALTVPTAMSLGAFGGNDVVQAAVTKARSLVDLLDQRSPGERTQAELTKTKRARAAAAARRPHAVPTADRSAIVAPVELAALLESPPALVDVGQPIATLSMSPPSIADILVPSPGSPGTPGSPGSPGAPLVTPPGGDEPKTFPTPQPPEILVPTPAVPEPGTWAMMLLGFGCIGWRLRRGAGRKSTALAVR
jgi:PEP-CTERM motif